MLSRRDTPSNSEERAAGCSRARWANHFVHPDGAAFPFWRAMKGSTTGNRTFIVEGSWGALIVDELKPAPGDHLVVKKGFGGFANTPLDTILRNLGVDTCVVAGVTTCVCVSTTIRRAWNTTIE